MNTQKSNTLSLDEQLLQIHQKYLDKQKDELKKGDLILKYLLLIGINIVEVLVRSVIV